MIQQLSDALILQNPEPYTGGNPKFHNLTQLQLELYFIPPCCEIIVGSERTFFEFEKDIDQDDINHFCLLQHTILFHHNPHHH